MMAPISIAALDAPVRADAEQTSQLQPAVAKPVPKFPSPDRAPPPFPVPAQVSVQVEVVEVQDAADQAAPTRVQAASSNNLFERRELPEHHEAAFFAQLMRALLSSALDPLSKVVATRLRIALVLGAIVLSSASWLMLRGSASSSSIARDLRPSSAIGALASQAPKHPDQHATTSHQEPAPRVPATDTAKQAPVDPQRTAIAARPTGPGPSTSEKQQQLERAKRLVETAMWQQRAGRLAPAEASYLSALKAWPTYGPAMVGVTRVYIQRKNGAEAVRWAKQLIALHPSEGHYHLLLGDAYTLRGERSQAEQAWQRAARLGNAAARTRLHSR
jgi:tetratricopeptide (TPR) repeat protein